MNVTLSGASLTGAISSAELTLAIDDGSISFDNIRDVGVITRTVLTNNPWARLHLTLKSGAVWIPTETCYLSELTLAEDAVVKAEPGYLLKLTVDGEDASLDAPCSYAGKLVVEVLEDPDYVPEPEEETAEAASAEVPEAVEPEPAVQAAETPMSADDTEPADAAEPEQSGVNPVIPAAAVAVAVIGIGAAAILIKRRKDKDE